MVVGSIFDYLTKIKAIKESGLYLRRAEVMDTLLEKFLTLKADFDYLIMFDDSLTKEESEELKQQLFKRHGELVIFFNLKQHYLPLKIAKEIKDINGRYSKQLTRYNLVVSSGFVQESVNYDELQEVVKELEDLGVVFDKIIENFRQMIGVK